MPTDLSELETISADFGGLFDLSILEDVFRDLLLDLVESAKHLTQRLQRDMGAPWSARQLHVAFTPLDEVNAWVKKGAYADYIFIPLGVVEKVYGAMCGLMSIPGFLPEIGDPSKERAPGYSLRSGLASMPLLESPNENDVDDLLLPIDKTRLTFAFHASSLALHFLIYHEIGHIISGHLELSEFLDLSTTISEIGVVPSKLAREYDADVFAAYFESYVDLDVNSDSLSEEVFGWKTRHGNETAFITHAIAISVLFRLLSDDGVAPSTVAPEKHPHPAVRSCLALSRAMTLAVKAGRFEIGDFERLGRDSVLHVEKMWIELDLPGQRFGNQGTWAEQISRLSTDVVNEYKKSEKVLAKFRRLPARWHDFWPGAENKDASC